MDNTIASQLLPQPDMTMSGEKKKQYIHVKVIDKLCESDSQTMLS